MVNARSQMDQHIYGMKEAKTQIMQIISQWIVNPGSVGNVIALQGPMGVGKTSFARNGIASVLQRPFLFYTLGGASDIANFVGHSYTYEGSMCGRIVEGIMQAGVMNPVLYFDELDKVSSTPHGEEIISMLIHLTDRSQNTEFHDRYFAGIDFDMSQCLFVFSFNDIEKVHPILRDRMNVINCGGYDEKDKLQILNNYVWPDILKRLAFTTSDIIFEEDAMKFIIDEYSNGEGGVRNLIRAVETAVTRLNMLRVSKHESMKDYPFYMDISFPLKLTPQMVQTLLKDNNKKKQDETWRMMYM
jgi:ATP-dependent Lon protease